MTEILKITIFVCLSVIVLVTYVGTQYYDVQNYAWQSSEAVLTVSESNFDRWKKKLKQI